VNRIGSLIGRTPSRIQGNTPSTRSL